MMWHTLKIKASWETRYQLVSGVLFTIKYGEAANRIGTFLKYDSVHTKTKALEEADSEIWSAFFRACDTMRISRTKFRMVKTYGIITSGYRITVPYSPANVKAIQFDFVDDELTVKVLKGDDTFFFGRGLHKLAGNVHMLKYPVAINGETLNLGYWLCTYLCKAMDDPVSAMMYHDEGVDKS